MLFECVSVCEFWPGLYVCVCICAGLGGVAAQCFSGQISPLTFVLASQLLVYFYIQFLVHT